MTFGSGVLDQYHVSADTSKNWLDVGYCKVIPNNVASIQKNRRHKSHRVIVASDDHILDNSGYVHKEWFLGQFGNRHDTMWTMIGEIEPYLINPEWSCSHRTGSGMLHICFGLAMATLPQVRENDNAIPKTGPIRRTDCSHLELSIPKSYPSHNRPKNRARSFGSAVNRRPISYSFQGAPIIDQV